MGIQPQLLLGVGWAVLVLAGPAGGAEGVRIGGPIPQQVLDDWQARRNACRHVYYQVEFRELLPPGFLNGPPEDHGQWGMLPKSEMWREREFTVWIDLIGQRMRCEIIGRIPDIDDNGNVILAPMDRVEVREGSECQLLNRNPPIGPEGPGVALTNWSGSCPLMLDGELLPCRWGLGVDSDAPPGPSRSFLSVIRPEDFRVHAVHQKETSSILVLRGTAKSNPRAYMEMEVDLDHASEIVGFSGVTDGRVTRRLEVTWSRTTPISHPLHWTDVSYRGDGRLRLSAEGRVKAWSFGPDLSGVAFRIEPEAGTFYANQPSDEVFVKSPDVRPDMPYELYAIQQHAAARRRWWIASGVLAALLGGGLWFWHRRRAQA